MEEAGPSSAWPQPHTVRVGIILDLRFGRFLEPRVSRDTGCSSLLAILGEGRQQQLSGSKQVGLPDYVSGFGIMDSCGQQSTLPSHLCSL